MPQLIEQWRLQSADGIAIGFISIWFLGDLFNLVGSIWANLLPEVVFLAVWFCIADAMMITSYVYYKHVFPKRHHRRREHAPLLDDHTPRRRLSTLTDMALEPENSGILTKYVLPILFVVGAGIMGFVLSGPAEAATDPIDDTAPIAFGPQVLGYCSAFLYLGARIPQIVQNYERKSVHGLSLLFFLFLTLGNLTYAGQILFYRTDSKYIILNLSWLLGSLGTIFEDTFIIIQFYMYRETSAIE